MAKRGPKSTSTSKGRPRTRSQIKPLERSASPSQSPLKKPKEKKPATPRGSNKKAKSATENTIEKISPTKIAKTRVEKEKKEPKKASKKATKNSVDQSEKPAKAPVKRTRKPKAKNITSGGDEQVTEPKVSKVVKLDNDDTEDEEVFPASKEAPQSQLYGESTNQNYYNASSYNASSGPVHQAASSHLTPHTPLLSPGGFHAHASTTKAPFQFESSLEKLQQETMAPKPFNVNNQEANYLSPLYPNATLTSSSTSAFSAPAQPPKHYQSTVTHSETNHPNILSPSSMSSVNMPHQSSMIPNHQNLLSPPQISNPGPDLVHDLPPELLQQGWRKFWSKRENRPYFFNKNTNESLWELPKLSSSSGHYDPVTDPLGIQASNSNTFQPPPTPTDPGTPPIYPVFNPAMTPFGQRNHEQALTNGKKTLVGPFDFDIDSNCFIWEGLVFYYFHAHPETELSRCNFINKLRQQYYELCHTRESIEPPKDSFTRWILERKITDKGCDPFLPSDCPVEMSKTLYNEIMNDIPIKQINPKFGGEARKQLSKYAEAAKKIIDSPHVSAYSRKIVKWNVEDAFEWIRKTLNATYDDYIERLEHLKKQCQPHIIEAARSSVEAICLKIYHVSVEYSKRIRDQNVEIFKKEELRERPPMRLPNQKKVVCYPAYLINPCPKLPGIQMFTEKDGILLRYKGGEFLRLNTVFQQKLEILYFYNCRDDRKYMYFLTRVWCMIKRYQTFFNKNEGISSQHSLPLSVFASLNKHFGVTFECFASPLNCYFRQYCSLFPDTDSYFGSRGSILNFYPMSGSFQAHPPDCAELIEATVSHFDKLLENSVEPLSFILFIQEVPETTQKIIPKLESNKFKRTHLTIPALEHEYRHGFQYVCNPSEIIVTAQYNMLVYFLQNDAGFLKWGPTPERVEDLVESFKLGQDKELQMLSPPATPANNQKPETEVRPNGNESKDLPQ